MPKDVWQSMSNDSLNLLRKSCAKDPISFCQLKDTFLALLSLLHHQYFCTLMDLSIIIPTCLLFFSWYIKIPLTQHLHNLYSYFSAPFWKRSSQSITYIWLPSIFVFSFSLKLPPVRVLLPPPHLATLVKNTKDLHIVSWFHAPHWNISFTWLRGHCSL